jgi:hypothetical protein
MPLWADTPEAPLDPKCRWGNHNAALQRHEDGQIQHGRELALLVKERLMQSKSTLDDCFKAPHPHQLARVGRGRALHLVDALRT